jgi:glycosyltransferase involved in cell wall biosynthesis
MKVLVINGMAPFIWGGAEELALHLVKNLNVQGYQTKLLRIPFQWEPYTKIPTQMLIPESLELDEADRVIALKFPAYLVNHSNKTIWLMHQYRQAYDLLDSGQSNIADGEEGDLVIQHIKRADAHVFSNARRIYTNSPVTSARLKHYNGFDSEVLQPPPNDPELFIGGEFSDYIFAGGRVNSLKRQSLLIEALALANPKSKLVIAGPPETNEDKLLLESLITKHGLEERVTLDLRFLPRVEYADYMNNCMACAYIPFDEDSIGYVSLEGAIAGKPILTTSDSGGILGLVNDGVTGWVADASPESLAEAINRIHQSGVNKLHSMGLSARQLSKDLDVDWPGTIARLMA